MLIPTLGRQRQAYVCIYVSSKPAWSIERVAGQPDLHREALTLKKKEKNKQNKTKQNKTKQNHYVFSQKKLNP